MERCNGSTSRKVVSECWYNKDTYNLDGYRIKARDEKQQQQLQVERQADLPNGRTSVSKKQRICAQM